MRVTASNGVVGWGEAFGGSGDAGARRSTLDRAARGRPGPDRHGRCSARFERALHNFGRAGPVIYALGGLDIALWDMRGKLEGVPVYALLGGKKRERVEVYASLLAYGGNVEHVKRNTARALERGYRQIKLHEKTAEAVAATREAAGAGHPDHGRHQLRLAAGCGLRRRDGDEALRSALGRGADLAAGGCRFAG